MKKFTRALALILCLCLLALAACGNDEPAPTATAAPTAQQTVAPATATPAPSGTEIRVATLMGPTGMGMSYLMQKNEDGESANNYAFTLAASPNDVTTKFISGEIDVAALPINLAAVLAARTDNVRLLAINTLGVLYVVENGDSIQSMADLSGKTVYATGQGSTPEYVLSYLLAQNGLSDTVRVEYLTEHSELTALLASGQQSLGMLPEPNVTVARSRNPDLRVALDLTGEWESATGTQLVQGCIIARADFAVDNAGALSAFLAEYAESVEQVNADPSAAAELIVKFGIVESAAVAEAAIPNCNIVCITGEDMVEMANTMFAVLYEANASSIGGEIPDAKIYF